MKWYGSISFDRQKTYCFFKFILVNIDHIENRMRLVCLKNEMLDFNFTAFSSSFHDNYNASSFTCKNGI